MSHQPSAIGEVGDRYLVGLGKGDKTGFTSIGDFICGRWSYGYGRVMGDESSGTLLRYVGSVVICKDGGGVFLDDVCRLDA